MINAPRELDDGVNGLKMKLMSPCHPGGVKYVMANLGYTMIKDKGIQNWMKQNGI